MAIPRDKFVSPNKRRLSDDTLTDEDRFYVNEKCKINILFN